MKSMNPFFTLALIFSLSLQLFCAESEEEILTRLNQSIEAGEKQKALNEINHILIDLNEDFSETIRSASYSRNFVRNQTGTTAAWIEGDTVYFFNGKLDSVSLEEYGTDLQLSGNGKFGLIHSDLEDQCLLLPFSLETAREYPEIILDKCEGRSAILDNGEIWYVVDKKIYRKKNPESEEDEPEEALTEKRFNANYKKLKNDFYLYSVTGNDLLIFYGTAGSYTLYRYNPEKDKLSQISSKPVKPQLVWTQKTDPLYPENEPGKSKSDAWIFTGSAGKYTLSSLVLGDRAALAKEISNIPMKKFIPLAQDGELYYIDDQSFLGRFSSMKKSGFSYPFRTTSFIFINSGLIYNDEQESVKFRNTAFSDFEKKLLNLKNKAEEN